jgi:hypothetical protein
MKFKKQNILSLVHLNKKILILFQKIKIKSEKVHFFFKKIIKINKTTLS